MANSKTAEAKKTNEAGKAGKATEAKKAKKATEAGQTTETQETKKAPKAKKAAKATGEAKKSEKIDEAKKAEESKETEKAAEVNETCATEEADEARPVEKVLRYDRAVTEAPFQIGISMRQVSPFSYMFRWDTCHYHYGMTRSRVNTVLTYLRQQGFDAVSVNLKKGQIVLSDRKRCRMVQTGCRRVRFDSLPAGPQETAPAIGRPTGMVLVRQFTLRDRETAPQDFDIRDALVEITNLVYATCAENPAADAGYFGLFSETEVDVG